MRLLGLKTTGTAKTITTLDDLPVGVQTADRRLTWFGFSLSAAFGDVASPELTLSLFDSFGIRSPFTINGDRLIALHWDVAEATDLLDNESIGLDDGTFAVNIEAGGVKVAHCSERE